MEDASKWYGELMNLNESIDPEYYFRYAQALKYLGNYKESDIWMNKFHSFKTDDSRGNAFINKVNYLEVIESKSRNDIQIKNLDINSPLSDFGTSEYNDKIIFASSRREDGKIYKWNEQPYLDLYSATKQNDSSYSEVKIFAENLNTQYHESSTAFSPDGTLMFFTRNNYYKKKLGKDKRGTNKLQLYRSRKDDKGNWSKEESIHFNNRDYSVAHPTISNDGTKLYFASDMPGTNGQSDLFCS